MLFSSSIFLFLFLPALFLLYFLVPQKFRETRNNILLIASLGFYAWGEPVFVFVMIFSIIINYICGFIATKYKKLGVFLAIFFGLGLLIYYKYTILIIESVNSSFGLNLFVPEIILPIGISFFTFQGLSYVIDVSRKDAPVQKNPLHVALYISLFPQLIAGPIVRYQTVANEIVKRNENIEEFASGARRFMLGLSKKILLSNAMGQVADDIFGLSQNELTWDIAWIGAFAYTMQIYFDFSGYSDMAIGLGKIFGFHFLENFNYPYISKSITEFWRRWHISLSTWFRDYVYIPLGGNRCSKLRWIFNIMIVWTLTGIWHGAAWNFMLWGFYFGFILMCEKLFLSKILDKMPTILCWIYSFVLIILGWVIFRSQSFEQILYYIKTMFTFNFSLNNLSYYYVNQYIVEIIACIICSMPIAKWFRKKEQQYGGILTIGENIWAFLMFGISVVWLISSTFNPFIYFRF